MTAGAADLGAVDELCRIALVARRLGCRLHVAEASLDLQALLDLAGVGDVIGRCPAEDADRPTLRRPPPGAHR